MSPCSEECVGAVSLIRYARKPHLDHLDSVLHERADRPLRLWNSPVCHHLPVSETSETFGSAGWSIRGVAERDDATSDFQRGLCCGAAAPVGQRDRLPEGPAPDPGP